MPYESSAHFSLCHIYVNGDKKNLMALLDEQIQFRLKKNHPRSSGDSSVSIQKKKVLLEQVNFRPIG